MSTTPPSAGLAASSAGSTGCCSPATPCTPPASRCHAALWPAVSDLHLVASRHYAFEGRCFVVALGSVLRRDQIPADLAIFQDDGIVPDTLLLAGGSAIIGPDGHFLAGPAGSDETILYADLDLARIPAEHLTFDAVGHYGRPDVFTLTVNTAPQTYLNLDG